MGYSKYEHFTVKLEDEIYVIELLDPRLFDTRTVTEIGDELKDFANKVKPSKVLVDFKKVGHTTTNVINGLLAFNKVLWHFSGQVKLCNMEDTIRENYRLLNIDGTIFNIYDTYADAMAAF